MTDDLLDIERLRKLWEARPEEQGPVAHPALAPLDAPPAPFLEPRELLARLEQRALERCPAQRDTLKAFFQQAWALMDTPAGEPGAPPADNRAALQTTLNHLEELLEVFALGLTR